MVDDSYATEMRELKAEQKQVGQAHKKALAVVEGLEKKLDELRTGAQDALRALDAAERTLLRAQEAHEAAKEALEAASPEHLRERMHAADLLRVSAVGAKDKAEETLNNGASHQAVLQRRVDETDARLRQLLENKETRLIRVDEPVSYTHLTLPTT